MAQIMYDTSSSSRMAHIVGIGAQTPLGASAPAGAAAVRAGIANFTDHPSLVDAHNDPVKVSRATWLSEDLSVEHRMLSLAAAAADEALRPAAEFLRAQRIACPLYLGVPSDRPGFRRELGVRLWTSLQNVDLSQKRTGGENVFLSSHAAGLLALEEAWQSIIQRRNDICLVGAVDSYLTPETICWLDRGRQLHAPSNSWGFTPGEAAGFLLVASDRLVRQANLNRLATIVTVAAATEFNIIKSKTVCTGEGLTKAFRAALAAMPPGIKVDQLICDLNGEPYRADEFGFTLIRTSDFFRYPGVFRTPADCWGDVGAASGPLFVTLLVAAAQRGYSNGEYTMLSTSGEEGTRCAAVLFTELTRRRPCP